MSLTGFGYGFAFNYNFFVLMRLLCAIGGAGFILSSFVLSVEFVGRENRNFAGLLGTAMFALGYCVVALGAFLVREWRHLIFMFSGLGLCTFLLWR
jgi:MFS family permease